MRVLIAEDDQVLANQINRALTSEGLAVDLAFDGSEAKYRGDTEPYDVIILDTSLPVTDWLGVLKHWRMAGNDTPVLLLTARSDWTHSVDGLDAGADDYVAKPFHMAELMARVRATARRRQLRSSPVFVKNDVTFDSRTNQVLLRGVSMTLTRQEVAVLSHLFHNAGRLVSRAELSQHIYGQADGRESNTIAVFVNRLRKKLGPDVIETVRGRGYVIKASI